MYVTAIIAAGGRGRRFGGAQPKQLLSVGGRPILERSVAAFLAHPQIDEIVVALPQESGRRSAAVSAPGARKPLRIVAGGARRQDSVANAFRRVDAASDIDRDPRRGAAVRERRPDRADDRRGGGVAARRWRRCGRATR